MEIITLETSSLGDRSYLVTDGSTAAVVDPQRDIDRITSILDERDLRLTHVFETHIHNDYVTGGLELARRTGAAYVLSADDEVGYERVGAADGDEFEVGQLVVRAVHTPGHTHHHLSYVLLEDGRPAAVFTGGSMLYGTVGRTDLISDDTTEELTRAQFRSVRRLADELPDDVAVMPTHGFGSFCSSSESSDVDDSTIRRERLENLAFSTEDEDAFVEQLLSGLTAHPRYYAHMAPINVRGPAPVDLSPPEEVDPVEIRRRIHAGEWVVDLRSRTAFARGHLAGTLNLEVGDDFATYLGWTLEWGTPVTLVGDTAEEVAEAQRQMVRIGIDRPAGGAHGGPESFGRGGEIRSYRTATFDELAAERERDEVVVLDVRRHDEWDDERVDGATHIPLDELEGRLGDVPDGEVWVHCASGYRAALAASMLDRAGRAVVVIDDEFAKASEATGLSLSSGRSS